MITTNAHNPRYRTINCGSGYPLFNPFKSPENGSAYEVADKYRYYLQRAVELEFLSDEEKKALNEIYKLASNGGVNLACDCGAEYCHTDAIKELIKNKLAK